MPLKAVPAVNMLVTVIILRQSGTQSDINIAKSSKYTVE